MTSLLTTMTPAGCVGSQPACDPLLAAAAGVVVAVVEVVVLNTRASETPKIVAWMRYQQTRPDSEA
jgi:hypothetical protein